jgi:RNA polymerase sigma-70 factor (ECF subfamily)
LNPQSDPFAAAYERHLADIVRYLRRRLGDDAAEDAAAEVFARAFRRADVVEHPSGSPLPWLYGIAANVITERRRAETRRLRALERLAAQPNTASSDPEGTTQLDPDLMRAVRDLKEVDRETLLLVAWGELTYEQTAQALDVPIGTIRSRLARARRQLSPTLALRPQTDPSPTTGRAHV